MTEALVRTKSKTEIAKNMKKEKTRMREMGRGKAATVKTEPGTKTATG
jgi:hypothetical protein